MIPEPHFTPTVPGLIGHFAAQHGEAEALVRDGLRVTFTELDRRSAAVARALIERGAGKGARIAILAPPSPEFVIAVLAAARIGAVAGPLSTLYQAPELAWVLANAEFDQLIVADAFLRHDYLSRLEEALPGLAGQGDGPLHLAAAPRLRHIHVIGSGSRCWSRPFDTLLAGSDVVDEAMLRSIEALVTPADPACIIHTSGSTANPKGVIHGHGPLVRHSWQMGMGFTPFGPGDRVIVTRAMFWVAGFVATLFYSLNNGACLITTSDGSPANVARLIEEEGGNALAGDVGWFDVLRESDALKAAQLDVVRLNMDTAGIARDGRFLSAHLVKRIGDPIHHPAARFARTFGMTETLGGHTSARFDELLPEDRPSWQGRAVPGVELKIVDPVTRRPLPAGEVGELLVRGYCLMQSLNGRERHEVFDAEGYYPTGDLCRLDVEGYLKFEARRGEMIKIHGANVAPLEVELAMTGLLGIEKAGVVGVARNGDTLLAAAVLMAPGRALDEAAVIAELKRRLSSFKVPTRIVALDESTLPATGSGKIKKAELTQLMVRLLDK
ncbi:class I adenylate-forming enzyme family protein [Sphingopyxis panaciterrulae]|uniref:Acyl-coenzyme A synthetase/AMP-(Fatty) acid ligase n=1 Tax=Sphingopyxis panaciterrulae TaxID=462372 RepID=A0A7W9B2N8_9SPHN|nr:class I adenylate-forming enzyme family protein [Sphingopyxis panaciterrulae]MBB5705098.1 acyl-coenzyme A synthetase/AMP-(fatty) acid ligase [Sphingopyxis panaciterrulae]